MLRKVVSAVLLTTCLGGAATQVFAGSSCDSPVRWNEASRYSGSVASFSGPVVEVVHRSDIKGAPTWINVGRAYPDKARMTLLVWGKDLSAFGGSLQRLQGRTICATGRMGVYGGAAEMEVSNPSQISVK